MLKAAETLLVFLLRFMGISALFALVPVIMPMSWMAATHRRLGLGTLPEAPIVEYLARSLSAFYFLFGLLCLLAASNRERYRPLVLLLAWAFLLMGIVFTWVDFSAGMPWWWSVLEGPPQIALGALLLFLARAGRHGKGDQPGAAGQRS